MLTKINKTYAGLVLALTLAVASAVYAQFTLISGGTGYGYGYGYGAYGEAYHDEVKPVKGWRKLLDKFKKNS